MSLNHRNDKCKDCKYSGVYMCTSTKPCSNNDLYEKRK